MSNFGQIAGGLAGGIIGAIAGGPVGAAQGFALGFAVASVIFPPDLDESATPEDPFKVTTATEGTPVPVMFGRRSVPGNVVFFDYARMKIDEVTPNGKGKGGFGKGSDTDYGTFVYAPVAIGICIGEMTALHGVFNQKNDDWQKINSDNSGSALQFSSPPSEIDFGYGPKEPTTSEPKSAPIKGITLAYSPKLFVGKNTRNMTPLTFDVEITVSAGSIAFCGHPTDGMPEGCVNPANIYYMILTNKQWALGLSENLLSQQAFQDAHDVYEAEGFGLAPLWNSLLTAKRMFEDLNFHVRSILRRSLNEGKIELLPIRNRAVDWTLQEEDCADENVSGRSWKKLPNIFIATYPDINTDVPFTQRTINLKNESAQKISGRRTTKTYNFPHITNRDLAIRRLELQKRHDSYPLVLMSTAVSMEFHNIRVGDIVSVNHPKFKFVNFEMRVVEVRHPEFTGMSVRVRLLQEIPTLDGQVGPPIPDPDPPVTPRTEPCPTEGEAHTQEHWKSRISGPPYMPPHFPPTTGEPPVHGTSRHEDQGGPIYGPDSDEGYFGYPVVVAQAEGCSTDVAFGFEFEENSILNLPINKAATTLAGGRGHLFTLDEELKAGDWKPALEGHGITMTKSSYGENDEFDLPDQDGVNVDGVLDLETSPYVMVIGNYEYCLWGRSLNLGNDQYRFELVMRGTNKVRLRSWPSGTPVMIFKIYRPIMPQSLTDFLSWAHRPRHISTKEYNEGRRIKLFLQTISYAQRVQSVPQQFTQVFDSLETGAPGQISGIYQPLEILQANRAPTPSCQGYIKGNARAELRSWYPLVGGAAEGDMIVQMQPFANDWEGIGDRVVSDSPLIESFGEEPYLPTDLVNYEDYLEDVDGGRASAITYRLRVWRNQAEFDSKLDPALTTFAITDKDQGVWPNLKVPLVTLNGAGGTMGGSPMMVDVLTPTGHYTLPQAVSKIGVTDTTTTGTHGGGNQLPQDHYPDDTE